MIFCSLINCLNFQYSVWKRKISHRRRRSHSKQRLRPRKGKCNHHNNNKVVTVVFLSWLLLGGLRKKIMKMNKRRWKCGLLCWSIFREWINRCNQKNYLHICSSEWFMLIQGHQIFLESARKIATELIDVCLTACMQKCRNNETQSLITTKLFSRICIGLRTPCQSWSLCCWAHSSSFNLNKHYNFHRSSGGQAARS